jgi:hypothetical protein
MGLALASNIGDVLVSEKHRPLEHLRYFDYWNGCENGGLIIKTHVGVAVMFLGENVGSLRIPHGWSHSGGNRSRILSGFNFQTQLLLQN